MTLTLQNNPREQEIGGGGDVWIKHVLIRSRNTFVFCSQRIMRQLQIALDFTRPTQTTGHFARAFEQWFVQIDNW